MFRTPLRIAGRLISEGPVTTTHWTRFHLDERSRERQLGENTEYFAPGVDRQNNDCERYEPTYYRCIEQALDELDSDSQRNGLLVFRCGMDPTGPLWNARSAIRRVSRTRANT